MSAQRPVSMKSLFITPKRRLSPLLDDRQACENERGYLVEAIIAKLDVVLSGLLAREVVLGTNVCLHVVMHDAVLREAASFCLVLCDKSITCQCGNDLLGISSQEE